MAAKPLTTEAIALTEKKMDMTLGVLKRTFCVMAFLLTLSDISNIYRSLLLVDDIIKMSKNTKNKKQRRVPVFICFGKLFSTSFCVVALKYLWRLPFHFLLIPLQNKPQKFSNNFTQDKSAKVQRYMESRSSLRQVHWFLKHSYLKFLYYAYVLVSNFLFLNTVIRRLLQKEGLISRGTNFLLQLKLHEKLLLLLCRIEFLTVIGWLTGIKQGIYFLELYYDVFLLCTINPA